MPLGTEVGLNPGDFVLDGDPAPPQKGGTAPSPIFGPFLSWPNGCMDQDGTWHGGGPWSRPHCSRWGPAPLPNKGVRAPNFRQIFIAAKRLDASRLPLGMEVGVSPGDFVLDGTQHPCPKEAEPPIFGRRLLWPNACMDQDAAWYGGRPRPTRHCVRWGPSSPSLKGHSPQFSAIVRCGQTAG